ncbi:hypothetical protein MRS44_017961 [Fusarium solani]|uniref:uncharacterized protein n=1 Tax=Fusarium solani TaxID=169388 RepID=UPI0032C3E2A3|nr:hypothetical protein MRS44_017961 [Fusarium solani]
MASLTAPNMVPEIGGEAIRIGSNPPSLPNASQRAGPFWDGSCQRARSRVRSTEESPFLRPARWTTSVVARRDRASGPEPSGNAAALSETKNSPLTIPSIAKETPRGTGIEAKYHQRAVRELKIEQQDAATRFRCFWAGSGRGGLACTVVSEFTDSACLDSFGDSEERAA